MAVNLPSGGQENWDVPLNAAIQGIDADLQNHKAAADPHTGYQKESEKGQPSGYAALDGTGKVPSAQLPAGGGGGVTDHGALTGLTDNDHPQYQLASAKGTAGGYASLGGDGKVPPNQLPAAAAATSTSRFVPVVIINGESNSGGYANNSDATPAELAPRPCVQIFDNVGLSSFQDLHIPVNSLVGHSGMSQFNGTCHGLDLSLANSVDEGQWWDDTVYLIKTGQGGSQISQWNVGGAYYSAFLDRTRNGLAILRGQGKIPVIYFWYSLGINDAIAGTNEASWMTSVQDYFTRIRKEIGYVPIFSTQFMASSPGVNFNDSVQAIANADNMTQAIDATGTTTKDANHWDYNGMKLMGSRIVAATLAFGQHEGYMMRQTNMLAGGAILAPPADLPNLVRTPANVSFVEGSAGGTFTVALSKAPASNVVVSVSASGGNVTPSPTSLTFTTGNWSSAQTVTVTSPDDSAQNGTRTSTVTLSSVGVTASATVSVSVTDAYVNPGPINTALPTISGATTLGAVLTCSQGTWSGSPTGYTYQWKRDALDIAGATANTRTITAADQGHVLVCTVSATNAQGTNSATTANFSVPADAGSYVAYTWRDLTKATTSNSQIVASGGMPAGGNAVETVDATQAFRVKAEFPASSDANGVVVHFEDAPLNNTDFAWGGTQAFVSGFYVSTGKPYVCVNGTANTEIVGWTPAFPLQVRAEKSGNDIVWSSSPDGLTWTTRYTQTGVLTGKTTIQPRILYAIATTGQKVKVSYDSAALAPTAPVNTAVPVLTGSTAAGGVLTASTGTWTQTPTAYAYQWKRDGVALGGETTNQHTIVVADEGHGLTCTVTASNAQGSATATSASTAIPTPSLPANTVLPAITGSTALAGVLTCSTGTWDGGVQSYAYQWKRDDVDIAGETVAAHTVVAADQAHSLTCRVTATNGVGSTSATSAATAVPAASTMEPFSWQNLTNTTVSDNYLTASSASMPVGGNATLPVDVSVPFTIIIDWDSAAVTGAMVTMLDDNQDTNFTWSAQSFTTGVYNNSGVVQSAISGSSATDWGWTCTFPCKIRLTKSGNDVLYHSSTDGGNTWTLRFTHAGRLAGKTLQYVRVVFAAAAAGQKVKVSYDSTAAANVPPANTAAPAITGTASTGNTLTCSQGSWGGSPTAYAYQWKRDGANISGQTASTYLVVSTDENTTLTCAVTATNANGSNTATSNGVFIPPPGQTTNDVVWTSMTGGCTSPSAGRMDSGAGGGIGGLATTPLDLTKYWEVETVYDDPIGSSNATVVYIDDENSAVFTWNGTNTFITGHWQYNGDHNVGTSGGGTPIHTGKALTAPFRIKMVKSGSSDVALYYGAGLSGAYEGTPFYTHAGVMAGKTTGYIKALFAVGGSFHITVRYTQGS